MITLGNPKALPDVDGIDMISYNRTKSNGTNRPDCWRVEVRVMAGSLEMGQVSLAVQKGEMVDGASKDVVTRLAVDSAATTLASRIATKQIQVDDAYAMFAAGLTSAGDMDGLIEQAMITVGMIPAGLSPAVV